MAGGRFRSGLGSDTISMSVSGIDAVVRNFYAADKTLDREVTAFTKRMMEDTVAEAKRLCPVDKGHLRDSIRGSLTPKGYGYTVESNREYLMEKAKRYYAPYVELGTGKMSAQPFLRPAHDKMRQPFEQGLSKAVKDSLSHLRLS